MQYVISTLRDVFDKVPAHRIVDCLTELAVGMERAKYAHEQLRGLTGGLNGFAWPDSVTWVDDGADSLEIRYQDADGADLAVERAKVNPER